MKKRTKIICSAIILSTACIASSAQAAKAAGISSLFSGARGVGNRISGGVRGALGRFGGAVRGLWGDMTSCSGRRGNAVITKPKGESQQEVVYASLKISGGPTSNLPENSILPTPKDDTVIYTTVKNPTNSTSGRSSLSSFSSTSSESPYATSNSMSPNNNSKSPVHTQEPLYQNSGYTGHDSAKNGIYSDVTKLPSSSSKINVKAQVHNPENTTNLSSSNTTTTKKTPPPVAEKPKKPTPPPRTTSLNSENILKTTSSSENTKPTPAPRTLNTKF